MARPERRAHPRFAIARYATIEPADGEERRCLVVDVSLGGFRTSVGDRADRGTIRLTMPDEADGVLSVHAEARHTAGAEQGFRVKPKDEAEARSWVRFVHDVFRSQGESLLAP